MNSMRQSLVFRPKLLLIGSILIGISLLVLWVILPDRHLVYTVETGQRLEQVVFSPDGQLLATSADKGDIFLWNAADGTARGRLSGHKGRSALAFSPDGTLLVSASVDGTIRLWDAAHHTLHATLWTYPPPPGRAFIEHYADGSSQPVQERFMSVAFSPDGQLIFAGGTGERVLVFNAALGAFQRFVYVEKPPQVNLYSWMRSIAINRAGNVLLLQDSTQVQLFQLPSLQHIMNINRTTVPGLALNTGWAVFDTATPHLTIFYYAVGGLGRSTVSTMHDVVSTEGRLIKAADPVPVDAHFRPPSTATSFAVRPDARMVAWGGGFEPDYAWGIFNWLMDTRIIVWRLDAAQPTFYRGHHEEVSSLVFSPDGQLLASVSRDTTLRVWRVSE